MGITRLDAVCECDGCGKRFCVEIEPSQKLKNNSYEDAEDLARDMIRGGLKRSYTYVIRGHHTLDRNDLDYPATIQGGYVLCDVCSKKCDEVEEIGDRNMTKEEVEKALKMVEHG